MSWREARGGVSPSSDKRVTRQAKLLRGGKSEVRNTGSNRTDIEAIISKVLAEKTHTDPSDRDALAQVRTMLHPSCVWRTDRAGRHDSRFFRSSATIGMLSSPNGKRRGPWTNVREMKTPKFLGSIV